MKKLLKHSLLVIIFLSLSACGFHLRSFNNIPPELKHIAITAPNPYDPFVIQLKQTLRSSHVEVLPAKQAAIHLAILSTGLQTNLTTVSANTLVKTYNLAYVVSFQLTDKKGKVIFGPSSVTTNSTYTVSENQILGDNNLFALEQQNMEREAIGLLLDRFNSLQLRRALRSYSVKQHEVKRTKSK